MTDAYNTRRLLTEHCGKYPNLQIRDIFKYLYQSALGCEHMLSSVEKAVEYIKKEAESLNSGDATVTELDGEYVRVHLSYLKEGLSAETLGKLFVTSAKTETNGIAELENKLEIARALVTEGALPFSEEKFDCAANEWRSLGYPPIHHSEEFRMSYKPSYRVISKKFLPFLPLFAKIDRFANEKNTIVAIEGGSASGKSTLGELLRSLYDCTVLHTDDFFLRPEQRTEERYAEVGGNIDRERFYSEVLVPLSKNESINYRRFDCSAMTILPGTKIVPKRLTVVEGVYSMHPYFSEYYDLSVFLDVDPDIQKERINIRNSPRLAERFFSEWIPLENRYFTEMKIKERCQILITIK